MKVVEQCSSYSLMNEKQSKNKRRSGRVSAFLILFTLLVISPQVFAENLKVVSYYGKTGGIVGDGSLNAVGQLVNDVNICPSPNDNNNAVPGCDFDDDPGYQVNDINDPTDDTYNGDLIVRANDQFQVFAGWSVNGGNEPVTITAVLPSSSVAPGPIVSNPLRWAGVPGSCAQALSSISPDGLTLTCVRSNYTTAPAYSEDIPFNVVVKGGTPNGTTPGDISITIDSDNGTAFQDDVGESIIVTAAPRWNIEKSYYTISRNYQHNGVVGDLIWYIYRLEVDEVPGATDTTSSVLGNESLGKDFKLEFTDDLSRVSPNAELVDCNMNYEAAGSPWPFYYAAAPERGTATPKATMVQTCTQASGPGTPISLVHDHIDTSLDHIPTIARNGITAIPVTRAIATSGIIRIFVPQTDVIAGINTTDTTGPNELRTVNEYSSFDPVSISGQSNFGSQAESIEDNDYPITLRYTLSGSFQKYYAKSTTAWTTPVTGATTWRAGNAAVTPGANWAARLSYSNSGNAGSLTGGIICDIFDPNTVDVTDIPGSPGHAAKLAPYSLTPASVTAGAVFEYATGFVGGSWPPDANSNQSVRVSQECGDAGITWHSTTTAARLVGPISKVRVRFTTDIDPGKSAHPVINLVARSNDLNGNALPAGTIIPNYSSVTDDTYFTAARYPATNGWLTNNYEPKSDFDNPPSGNYGDRVLLVRGKVRIQKDLSTNNVSSGSVVDVNLRPSFTCDATTIETAPVKIIEMLHEGLSYQTGSATNPPGEPVIGSCSNLEDGDLKTSCTADNQILIWDLGLKDCNTVIPDLDYKIDVSPAAPVGTLRTYSMISAPADASPLTIRTANANMTMSLPSALIMTKTTSDAFYEIDETLNYTVNARNGTANPLTNVEIIDILPFNGDDTDGFKFTTGSSIVDITRSPGSDFDGNTSFTSVNLSSCAGTPTYRYSNTTHKNIDISPPALTNTNGTTTWCAGTSSGPAGSCGFSNSDVTAVWVSGIELGPNALCAVNVAIGTSGQTITRLQRFTNSAGAFANEISLPTLSNEVTIIGQQPVTIDDTQSNPGFISPTNPTTLDITSNDSHPDSVVSLDKTTVSFDPSSVTGGVGTDTDGDGDIDRVVVPNEGTWTVDANGIVTFTPVAGFTGDPSPISYTIKSDNGFQSEPATITVDYNKPSTISGKVELDTNNDNTGDAPLSGVTVTLYESDGTTLATDAFGNAIPAATTSADGSYSFTNIGSGDYVIKETNPANYSSISDVEGANDDSIAVTMPVIPAPIINQNFVDAYPEIKAIPETFPVINGKDGGITTTVLTSDTLIGSPVVASDVTITVGTSASEITLDPTTGLITVAPNTPAGTYQVTYTICENAIPTNCSTTTETVTVEAPEILAVPETFPIINGKDGGVTTTVLASDTLNGDPVVAADVTITVGTSAPELTLDPGTGLITVAPNTAAGDYQVTYTICENTNSTNCSTTTETVSVLASEILAVPEIYPVVNGKDGGVTTTVLASDTLNGDPVVATDVTITVGTSAPELTLDPVTGLITVAANTPAGDYQVTYTICENINATNCSTTTETVTVEAPVILAVAETYPAVNGKDGGVTTTVLASDTLNGDPVVATDVTITVGTSAPELTLDPSTGLITVAPNTPAGDYQVTYTICEIINPTNCSTTTETVTVEAPAILAVPESYPAVNGVDGGVTTTVLASDTLNGDPVVASDVTITVDASDPALTLDPATGLITVAPGTAAGQHTVTYTICEILNPTNCSTTTETVAVDVAPITAIPESFPAINGLEGGDTTSVLASDTLNGDPVVATDVTITVDTSDSELTLDPTTGVITVTPGTPAGVYEVTYTICENLNPTNCATTTEKVTVEASVILAIPESYPAFNGVDGGVTTTVLASDTLNGDPVDASDVTITVDASDPALTLDPATGLITVAPGTAAGQHTVTYTICENLNPTNCSTTTETVAVDVAPISAIPETFPVINGLDGGVTTSALVSDTLNGDPVVATDVTITVDTSDSELTLDPATGLITVAPNTPADVYEVTYTICENLNPTNCATTTETVTVEAAEILAVPETFPTINGLDGGVTTTVLASDTLNGNPVVAADVTITVDASDPGLTLDPITGLITVAPGTAAGPHIVTYTICENLNPTNCSTTTETVSVDVAPILAVPETYPVINGADGGITTTVLASDTLNGVAVVPADVTITVDATDPNLTLDPATGLITVAPGTPAGDHTVTYAICENLNPDNCSTTTETVTVEAAAIQAIPETYPVINGTEGGVTTTVLASDTLNGAPVIAEDVTITVDATDPNLTLDPATGLITVAPGTAAGSYEVTYTICENLNPDNCSATTEKVTVEAAPILAVAETFEPINGFEGGVTTNVLASDSLNGAPVVATDVTITVDTTAPELVLDPDTGLITVAAGTAAGTYEVTYTICENLNPDNCSRTTETVNIDMPSIGAEPDIMATIDGTTGGSGSVNVLTNDTINDEAVDPALVAITMNSSTSPGVTITPNGTLTVAPGTPAGTYTVEYTICEILNPTNCSTTTATVPVIVNLPPVAEDDSKEDQRLGQPVTIQTVANDSDPEDSLDPTSVKLRDPSGNSVTTLVIAGEGTWTVDPTTGDITFTPEPGYLGDPTPVDYTVKDTRGLESNIATVTIDYEEPAAIEGTVWLDSDKDNEIDPGEDRKAGWTLKIKDKDGNVIATTVTDAQGNYSVTGLIPDEYTVEFYNTNGTLITTKSTDGPLASGETTNLPLPVDPSGVVYDSTTSEVLPDVTLQLVNSQGTPVDLSCLGEGQQNQVTAEDGIYAFDVYPGAHPSCQNGETYTIKITKAPAGYYVDSTITPPKTGVYDSDPNESNCTVDAIANSGSCEVQGQPDAPQEGQDTTYYMDFSLNSGDSNVIFNHIPLDNEIARQTELDDDTVLLSKSANKKEISVGDQLYYTVRAENTKEDEVEVDVRDDLPKGFKFVANEAKLTRAGVDNTFGTADDIVSTIKATGTSTVSFGPLTLQGNEIVQIGYILKVGTAATQGDAINTVQVFASGSDDDIGSNIATATVAIVADSVLDQSTLIGKVFHDRDGDGYQDPANVTGLTVKSDYFGWNSLHLGGLNGRISVLDNPNDLDNYQKIIRMPFSKKNDFKVTTKQGTVITVDNRGQIKTDHTGLKKKGLTGQDIRVTTRKIRGIPTQTPVKAKRIPEKETDVLEITITNYGIHEEGIPGVRLATVDGLLIETDGYGRYHLPDVDGGRRGWGKNIVLKVDTATLPNGSRFTTENPRVMRLTGTSLNKINFGIQLPVEKQVAPETYTSSKIQSSSKTAPKVGGGSSKVVRVEVGDSFFEHNSHVIKTAQMRNIKLLADHVKQYGRAEIDVKAEGVAKQIVYKRAQSIRQALYKLLGAKTMKSVKINIK
ncbi:SpaA isopeptide-forming pilin-related protein [Cocleimonas sp. KMM 6892]|uniref:SdrD B-like domain-containing protein n=1 Tax=unclassified Cocleimonas TaxID=2639732 RepID=UPI002DB91517|nr:MULTISPECIES: SdrD B-like domain-containing protein [unclassified Cocleimonas]MEB8432362.1 SpaA isopeptide-forming pilin-related protein [Cocleimonas sp. KMM 6892]MEC4714552.1 SpaA isopeptide-forming pilin-related protein [Cocleimonas sp. KMM 6895]MEC4744634.1 SpaA isopeptide-forming pilin-related protein [Cocleimonas sp. KMM 6896]